MRNINLLLSTVLFLILAATCHGSEKTPSTYGHWMKKPQSKWPQITMINQIKYTDTDFPIGGCGFLLDTGNETVAVTAKHVLTYFKSEKMDSVSFGDTLVEWKMFPKDNPDDIVIIDSLINEDKEQTIDRIPSENDWLMFRIKQRSGNIQPLRMRTAPLVKGEPVYIVGWRYSDKNCPQVVYEGNYEESDEGSILISTKELSDNTMPGLSGSPVIDQNGYLLGLMSQKAGKLERVSSLDYPKMIIEKYLAEKEVGKK